MDTRALSSGTLKYKRIGFFEMGAVDILDSLLARALLSSESLSDIGSLTAKWQREEHRAAMRALEDLVIHEYHDDLPFPVKEKMKQLYMMRL